MDRPDLFSGPAHEKQSPGSPNAVSFPSLSTILLYVASPLHSSIYSAKVKMEITSILGVGVGMDKALIPQSPISSLSISSAFPPSTRSCRSFSTLATAITGEPQTINTELELSSTAKNTIKIRKAYSKSFSPRQAAILQVQESSDLGSTLARFLLLVIFAKRFFF